MRVLITGGSGLIGRALATDLARDGNEIILLSRRPEYVVGLPENVRAEKWDGRTAEGWSSLVDGATAIVNLAGEDISSKRWSDGRKLAIRQSRLHAGQAVVQAVKAAVNKPAVVIQASGIGYYGPRNNEEITEETPPGHDFLAKLATDWEASTVSLESLGIRRAVIRTGVVLSTAGGAFPRMLLPFRFFAGGRLGSGRQWFPWIHIADEVGAIRFLIENKTASGPFNLTAPVPLKTAGFSRLLGRQLRRPALIPTPAFALRLVFGEMATILLDGQRALPKRLLQLGYTFRFTEAGLALKDLLERQKK
ncbi:MAG: TIGR01777 family oxidoreductase [Dehalococcoidales bacterium]|nr:TIGR01777 family oxidoreductase [Dehalococcoidales bacterium]